MADYTYIGQHRFTVSSNYVGDVISNEVTTNPPPGEKDSPFNDIYFSVGNLDSTTDYHLSYSIPRFQSKEHTVLIYLVDEGGTTQQFLKRVQLPKAEQGKGTKEHTVVLYQSNGEDKEVLVGEDGKNNINIKESEEGEEYLEVDGARIDNFNYTTLSEIWNIDDTGDNVIEDSFIFRPLFSEGSKICYKLDRTSTDEYRVNGGHGYLLPKGETKCILTPLKNILGSGIAQSTLTRVGIWSRPGLEMAINGEYIKVGRSGYYELDSIPITSLAIYAKDFANDNFSIHYQYVSSTTTSG